MPTPANPRDWGVNPQAVEVVARRVRDAKHFRNPDGSYTGVFGRWVHYESAPGIWEEVDLTFRPDGLDHVMDRHVLGVRVSAAGVSAWEQASGQGIRWLTPTRPAISARRAQYSDQGLTWEYATRKSGVKLEAVVTLPLGPRTFAFRYALLGGASPLTVNANGDLVSDRFSVPRAFAVDAEGAVHQAGPWRILPGQQVAFDWDDTGVPTPYTLDPTTTFNVAVSGDDGQVDKTQDGVYPPGGSAFADTTSTRIFAKRDLNNSGLYSIGVALARWDTSSLSDTDTIDSATVRMFIEFLLDEDGDRNVTAGWYTAWPIDSADYSETAQTDALLAHDISTLTNSADNDMALDNVTGVDATGYTGIRFHVDGGQPTGDNRVGWASFDNTTNTEPRLLVTYTEGGGTTEKTGTDTATLSEASSLSVTLTGADSHTLSEAASFDFSATDSVALSESSALESTAADSAALTEAITLSASATGTDTATLSDASTLESTSTDSAALSSSASLAISSSQTDTGTLSESVAIALSASDSATLTDTSSLDAEAEKTGTDTGTLSEAASIAITATVTDTAALSETSASTLAVTGTDSAALAESSAIESTAADNAALSESTAIALSSTGNDSAALSESAAVAISSSQTDSAALTEASSVTDLAVAKSASDTVTLSETVSLAQSAADTGTLSEAVALAQSVSDTATLAEASVVGQSASDTASLSEAVALAQSVTDTGTLSESVSIAITASVTDSAALSESVETGLSATDSASLTEATPALALSALDSGSVTASVSSATATLTATDSHMASEGVSLSLSSSRTDSYTVSEAIEVGPVVSDSAALTDASTTLTAAVSATQSISFTEPIRWLAGERGVSLTVTNPSIGTAAAITTPSIGVSLPITKRALGG